jgi:hypothetical protein
MNTRGDFVDPRNVMRNGKYLLRGKRLFTLSKEKAEAEKKA